MSRPKGSKNKSKLREIESSEVPQERDDDIEEIPNELEVGLNQEGLTLEPREESDSNDGIMINSKWKLTSDSMNVILSRKSIARRGKFAGMENWTVEGYYGTIKSALQSMVNKEIMGTGLKDLQTIDRKLDELNTTIANFPIPTTNR